MFVNFANKIWSQSLKFLTFRVLKNNKEILYFIFNKKLPTTGCLNNI